MIDFPVIPEKIVVHLGAPGDNAENVTETFQNYIKNVASSEIYPTWPREALKANIYAQISVALNRIYTEYYRSRGYNFDITSSDAYDQVYVYGRDIYGNVAEIVDEIFTSYIKKRGVVEPLYAKFCDGVQISCNGLSQWGSVDLAKSGKTALEILQYYFGEDIVLVENVPIENVLSSAPPVSLKEGDSGRDVELAQRRLNRISTNFPGIPKIANTDGFFDGSTKNAVEKFQEVFGLTVDGIIGTATWYRILAVYTAVKNLYDLNSEGIRYSELSTQLESELKRGSASVGVVILQYYLNYIALFVPTVQSTKRDGVFGPNTENSVKSFQKTYGLNETGIVDRALWDKMQNIYYGLVSSQDFTFREGVTLPYPGRILREGLRGEDVRTLQNYLSFLYGKISGLLPVSTDGVYGEQTAAAVLAFQNALDLPNKTGRVNALTWDAIVSIYEDIYVGGFVNERQFPGYVIGG